MQWIGVDFDGTLAEYHGWKDLEFGAPIKPMVDRVMNWLKEGRRVKIFTARVAASGATSEVSVDDQAFADRQRAAIEAWCVQQFDQKLEVTAVKDFQMSEMWDDRAVGMETNTGQIRTDANVRA